LLEVRIRSRKLLVVCGREAFQAVQLGVAEHFPPGAARQVRGGLADFQAPALVAVAPVKDGGMALVPSAAGRS